MVSINSKDIVEFLQSEDIHLEWVNPRQDSYFVASIFYPVKQGFYFCCGQNIPDKITESLVLIEKGKVSYDENDNNSFLVLDTDPQAIYYSILNELFAQNSTGVLSSTAIIHPGAEIGKNVQIDHFCVIGECRIGDDSIIGSHTVIHDKSLIGRGTTIETHSAIGTPGVAWVWNAEETGKIVSPQLGGVIIGDNCFLGANTVVVRGSLNESTEIGHNSLLAPGSRIGHGTRIGAYVHFANSVATGGNTVIGNNCFVGSAAVFRPQIAIHDFTIVGAGAVVTKNTTRPGMTVMGVAASETKSKESPSGMPKPKSSFKDN
jgi:UDP-3-O-[3-hydroxymyristoyl] glucosamine N-acyltransferase